MTCYVVNADHLSLFERGHPQVSDRIDQIEEEFSQSTGLGEEYVTNRSPSVTEEEAAIALAEI